MTVSNLAIDLTDPALFANGVPHDVFDTLRERDPVHGQRNPEGGTLWSLTRHADIRKASVEVDTFSSAGGIVYPNRPERVSRQRHNVMFNDPPVHTRLRGFAAKAFSPAVVARFEDWVREICVNIVEEVSQLKGEFDAIPHIAAALPSQVIASILGVPESDRNQLVRLINRAFGEFDPDIGLEGSQAAALGCVEYAIQLRALKEREPGVDMATQLATPDPANAAPLLEDEYAEMMATLMVAGFETTHTLISQTLLLMARDESIRTILQTTDRRTLSRGVDELLRVVTPAMYFGRTLKKDVEFGGKHMTKGDFVMMWFVAGNRDPAVFENPHQFDIDRTRKSHLAFGAGGPHFCVGNALAKLEVELLLQEIARRGIQVRLADTPTRLPGIFINGLRKLPMRIAA